MGQNKIRILLNGKKAALPEIRSIITTLRQEGATIEVRVTWEHGDIHRFVQEAVSDGIHRIVAGGGDGTVNEVADAIVRLDVDDRPEMAILPLGTANDFATSCGVPLSINEAITFALHGDSEAVDIGRVNDRHFINVATGGFGAQITTETPPQLKNFLGGGAYTLTGIIKALNFAPVSGIIRTAESEEQFELIAGAICNGRQAGGGQVLAPDAFLDDGLLDVTMVMTFPAHDLNVVISEMLDSGVNGRYVKRFKTQWVETTSMGNEEQVNLDGEPYFSRNARFTVVPKALKLVLPEQCPCLQSNL